MPKLPIDNDCAREETVALTVKLIKEGLTYPEVAERIGFTESWVKTTAHNNGVRSAQPPGLRKNLPKRRFDAETVRSIRASEESASKIAQTLKVSASTISAIRKRRYYADI